MTMTQQPDATPAIPPGDGDTAQVADRVTRGVQMRLQRLSWDHIAAELGYTSRGSAYNAVMGAMRRQRDESLADLRDQESASLDRAAASLWPKVLAGDARAQDSWLRNRARYAKLWGLDAPVQVTISAGVQAELEDVLAEFAELVTGTVTHVDGVPTGEGDDDNELDT